MKTFRFIASAFAALLLATTLTGCSDDSFEDSSESVAGQQSVIGFGTYLSRATATRGTPYLEPAEIALGGGVGVFAMQTEGKKYDPTVTDGSATTDFDANLMQNIHLQSTLTDEQLQSTDANVADNWTYAPVRYWPKGTSDYASFMAYAPYSEDYGTLYDKDGQTTGDRTYIRHTVAPDPRDHTDLLYGDPANTTNMQLRRNADNTWAETGTFYTPTGSSDAVPSVPLKLKHALSRIGFVVTSSALKDPDNYIIYDANGNIVAKGYLDDQGYIEVSATAAAGLTITVNKIKFIGDNHSGEDDNPTGAFYSYGLLNLSKTIDDATGSSKDKPLWSIPEPNAKQPFIYDNTDTSRTAYGLYDGEEQGSMELNDGSESGSYIWVPVEFLDGSQMIGEPSFAIYVDWSRTYNLWNFYLSYPYFANYLFGSVDAAKQWIESGGLKELWKQYYNRNVIEAEWEPQGAGHTFEEGLTLYNIGNHDNDYMFVIPQDFSEGKDDLWVYIDYTVNYLDNVSGEVAEKGLNYKVYQKINQKFEPGHAYIIVLDIGDGNNFNSVKLSVQQTDWPSDTSVP